MHLQCRDIEDVGSICDNPLQYSCMQDPMDRGAWWTSVCMGHKEFETTEVPHKHTEMWNEDSRRCTVRFQNKELLNPDDFY